MENRLHWVPGYLRTLTAGNFFGTSRFGCLFMLLQQGVNIFASVVFGRFL